MKMEVWVSSEAHPSPLFESTSEGVWHLSPGFSAWPATAAFLNACHLLGAATAADSSIEVVGVASNSKIFVWHAQLETEVIVMGSPHGYHNPGKMS